MIAYIVFALIVCVLVLIMFLISALRQIKEMSEDIDTLKSANGNLRYQIDILQEMGSLKSEARKKAEQRMGGIDYDNVDTAISILHDNGKDG